ncbi:hypothetical protein HPG69_019113, partial [Diceros bicornis minor]
LPSSPPVVDTLQGKVLGKYVSLEGFAQPVAVFLGVPFAKPPLGSLRFAPPQPAEPWNFVKNTTSYPPMCSQDPVAGQMVSDLVMVWIHGGGLVVGGASSYDGLPLSAHENVVVVTIQYRLGIWGFFSPRTSDLEMADGQAGGGVGYSLELPMELEKAYPSTCHTWPVCSSVWLPPAERGFLGVAGSQSQPGEQAMPGEDLSCPLSPKVPRAMVLSPLAKNLFHRAISESGVVFTSGLVKKDSKATAQSHPFLPTVVDGVLLPKMPEEILAEKTFNTVPYIVGINKQEFGWVLPTLMGFPLSEGKLDQKTASSLLQKSYYILNIPEELAPVATEKYLEWTDDPVKKKDLFLELMGDVVFGVPSVTVARLHRDAGASTYMYEFQYRPSFSPDMKPKTVIGDHGDELFSVFGAPLLKEGASKEEIKLSKMGLPHWPAYDQKEGYLQIGGTTQAAQKLKDKEVAFWTELLAKEAAEKGQQTEHVEL